VTTCEGGGSGDIAAHILNIGQRSASRPGRFIPEEKVLAEIKPPTPFPVHVARSVVTVLSELPVSYTILVLICLTITSQCAFYRASWLSGNAVNLYSGVLGSNLGQDT
jgi:hypothetical protein